MRSLIRGSLINVIFNQGGLSSVWSLIRGSLINVIFNQGGLSPCWPLIRIGLSSDGLSSVSSHIKVVFLCGFLGTSRI